MFSNGATATLSASTSTTSLGASVSSTGLVSSLETDDLYTEYVTFSGTDSLAICPGGNGVVECYGGGAPNDPSAGTTLTAAFYFTVNGTTTGALNYPGYVPNNFSISVTEGGSTEYLFGTQANPGTNATGELVSKPFMFKVGVPLSLAVEFSLNTNCNACSVDFVDPELTDLVITDPSTGLPVLGLTAVGDEGTVFPVDVGIAAPTPEPSSLALLAVGLIAVIVKTRGDFRTRLSKPPDRLSANLHL
jgi:hypothetical protein